MNPKKNKQRSESEILATTFITLAMILSVIAAFALFGFLLKVLALYPCVVAGGVFALISIVMLTHGIVLIFRREEGGIPQTILSAILIIFIVCLWIDFDAFVKGVSYGSQLLAGTPHIY